MAQKVDNRKAYVQPSIYCLSEPISYEEITPKTQALPSKPKKDQAVSEFHQLVTEGSRYLLNAGIPEDHIKSWLFEPWHYHSILKCINWWHLEIMPHLRRVNRHINQRSKKGWQMLLNMNRHHPDLKTLRVMQRDLKETWYKRPRFPQERGEVMRRGY